MESLLYGYRCTESFEATHLSLIGGKYKIQMHQMEFFWSMYAKQYTKGAHIVERVRYPSKWYIDLDHINQQQQQLLEQVLKEYGKPCIVCTPDEFDAAHVIFSDDIIIHDRQEACDLSHQLLNNTCLVFDKSVYSSGLRMVGSRKGKNVGRVYKPRYRILHKNKLEHISSSITPLLLKECSIISTQTNTVITQQPTKYIKSISNNTNSKTINLSFIHSEYSIVRVASIKTLDNDKCILFTQNKFCENVNRMHKSQHVYFIIEYKRLKQKTIQCKCLCKCNDTQCSKYSSKKYPIPIKLFYNIIQNK